MSEFRFLAYRVALSFKLRTTARVLTCVGFLTEFILFVGIFYEATSMEVSQLAREKIAFSEDLCEGVYSHWALRQCLMCQLFPVSMCRSSAVSVSVSASFSVLARLSSGSAPSVFKQLSS